MKDKKGPAKQLSRKDLRKQQKLQKKQKAQQHQISKQTYTLKRAVADKKSALPKPVQKKQVEIPQYEEEVQMDEEEIEDSEMAGFLDQFDELGQEGLEYEEDMGEEQPGYENEQMDSQDERIRMYEEKLNIKGSKSKQYDKIAQSLGFDDDLFSFLDNISKKVKANPPPKKGTRISEVGKKSTTKPTRKQNSKKEQAKMETHKSEPEEIIAKTTANQATLAPLPQNIEVRKAMNGLFNKLSDGNLLFTVRALVQIFENNPKSTTVPTFSNLFVRFNLMIEKPLVHVLSANVVIAVALHRIYGDRLMAQIVYDLTKGYESLCAETQDQREVEEIGYSRVFEKKKNYFSILCYLYEFSSISAEFIQTLVANLAANLTLDNAEFIYIVIQKCGARMRAHDTGALKETIEVLREGIENSKKDGTYETTKIKFIDIELNQIRYNRKSLFDADQRMGFLNTFLTKTVPAEIPLEVRTLDVTYDLVSKSDATGHQWWLGQQAAMDGQAGEQNTVRRVETEEMKGLRELAKAYHFVTEIRKNIFFELMSSSDYIEATKKILDLKVRRLQEVATVLLEVSTRQPDAFNPFYSLVAGKIAEEVPKFRVCLQFALWDRLKQLDQYNARKLSNLAKFAAWLISCEKANCSLSMFKYFPDLSNLRPRETVLMKTFFKEFLRKVSRDYLVRLSEKLRQDRNKGVRDGMKELLGEFKQEMNNEAVKIRSNFKVLRKMLLMQESDELEMRD